MNSYSPYGDISTLSEVYFFYFFELLMGIHLLEDACTSHSNFCSRSLCVYARARLCVFVCVNVCVAVGYNNNDVIYEWRFGNRKAVVASRDMTLSQFDLTGTPAANATAVFKGSKYPPRVL